MYIEPNSTIKLYRNVPLDNTYEHTVLFSSLQSQQNYFHGNTNILVRVFTRQSYQRVNKGIMRISVKADDIYTCNYLSFQNTNYGNKWFYAFVTSVEYINNEVSEIHFEIDVMQTYLFDVSLKECFVVREHTITDNVGDNLNEEPVELGEIVADDFEGTGKMGKKSLVLASTGIESIFPFKGGSYSGVFSGCYYEVFENTLDGQNALSDKLDNISSQFLSDRIVSVFVIPNCFVTEIGETIKSYSISKLKSVTTIGSYTPRNKKLLTYPYNFLCVDNLQGIENIYPYEFFNSEQCVFTLTGDFSPNGQALLIPMNYKGVVANYNEFTQMDTTVQCSFNTVNFIEGIALSGVSNGLNVIGANNIDKIKSGVSGGVNSLKSLLHGGNYHGVSNSNILLGASVIDFAFMHKHIQEQFAKRIDDFFDKYGYATNEVKKPNRDVRENWCYTKTQGCVIIGNAPADDVNKICSIYDNGVTFWKNPFNVGDYSLSNNTL